MERDVTRLLAAWRNGDDSAREALVPLVYDQLRALAGLVFDGQPSDHTLQPTALVNEAYLRLAAQSSVEWNDRKHFFRVAAQAMRQLLKDAARRRSAAKRGGGRYCVTLSSDVFGADAPDCQFELIDLDDALTRLAALDERQSRIVELRFLAGFSVEQVAETLEVSPRTVELDWRMARAWLRQELGGNDPAAS